MNATGVSELAVGGQGALKGTTAMRGATARILSNLLNDLCTDELRKNMMEKLVAPSIRLLYEQLMPYLWILVALMLFMLLLGVMTFCLAALLYFDRRGKRA